MKSTFIFLLKLFISFIGVMVYMVGTEMGMNLILKHMLVFALVIAPWSFKGKKSDSE